MFWRTEAQLTFVIKFLITCNRISLVERFISTLKFDHLINRREDLAGNLSNVQKVVFENYV